MLVTRRAVDIQRAAAGGFERPGIGGREPLITSVPPETLASTVAWSFWNEVQALDGSPGPGSCCPC